MIFPSNLQLSSRLSQLVLSTSARQSGFFVNPKRATQRIITTNMREKKSKLIQSTNDAGNNNDARMIETIEEEEQKQSEAKANDSREVMDEEDLLEKFIV